MVLVPQSWELFSLEASFGKLLQFLALILLPLLANHFLDWKAVWEDLEFQIEKLSDFINFSKVLPSKSYQTRLSLILHLRLFLLLIRLFFQISFDSYCFRHLLESRWFDLGPTCVQTYIYCPLCISLWQKRCKFFRVSMARRKNFSPLKHCWVYFALLAFEFQTSQDLPSRLPSAP